MLGRGPTGPPPAGARPPEAAAIAAAAPLTATTVAAVASGATHARAGDAGVLIACRIIWSAVTGSNETQLWRNSRRSAEAMSGESDTDSNAVI